ncbi:hypothetical protein A1704_19830 [Chryseobacterium cucumeris]|nr:hypothetical protein A1704_19830 [Chryseobacterium cucumeris]
MRKIIKSNKMKRPPSGGLKNTNDEKNLFRKIQTEYCRIIQHHQYILHFLSRKYNTISQQKNEYFILESSSPPKNNQK